MADISLPEPFEVGPFEAGPFDSGCLEGVPSKHVHPESIECFIEDHAGFLAVYDLAPPPPPCL